MHRSTLLHPFGFGLLIILGAGTAHPAPIQAPDLLAASEARNGLASWRDRRSHARIETLAAEDEVRWREVRLVEQADPNGGGRTRLDFLGPGDVDGTVLLRESAAGGEEQEWIWTPQMRRARRLPAQQPEDGAYGAEMSYRDLDRVQRILRSPAARARATIVGEEAGDGGPSTVVELPAPEEDPYRRYRVWLVGDSLQITRVDLFAAGETPSRRLLFREYATSGPYSSPAVVDVVRVADGGRTRIRLREVRYDTEVPEREFSLNRLMRGE